MHIVSRQAGKTAMLLAVVLPALLLFFTGCPQEAEDDYELKSGTLDFSATANGGTVYYSLTTGEPVTDPASTNWDVAFKRSRLIFTNSGATAADANSGGKGGVWHTDKTDFAAVTMADKKTDEAYTGYYADVQKWVMVANGVTSHNTLNIMTYCGYTAGDGASEESLFQAPLKYDQKQFYTMTMTGSAAVFDMSGQVYIIRHGDGAHHSKLQVVTYESDTSNMAENGGADKYLIQYANLN
jgi:hypothetical protein